MAISKHRDSGQTEYQVEMEMEMGDSVTHCMGKPIESHSQTWNLSKSLHRQGFLRPNFNQKCVNLN